MISAVTAASGAVPDAKPEKLDQAARDFESLLIAQLLRAARDANDSAEADSLMEMAEAQLASVLAANGGLGLAAVVTKGLAAAPLPPKPPAE